MILAPANMWSGPKSIMLQWINFKWLHNFAIRGNGTVDGQGSHWWAVEFDTMKVCKFIKLHLQGNLLYIYLDHNVQ